jgi:TrmH family RNA methyltransferase
MKVHKSDDIILTIEKLKSNGYQIIASEINSTSKPIQKLDIKKQHAIIFGNESHGIESNVLDLCDEIIHIPTTENTKSINVATSSGIMLFYLNNINFFR